MKPLSGYISGLGQSSRGVLVSFFVLTLLFLFLVPIPRLVLDVLLVVNLFISLTLLFKGLFSSDPVRSFFAFPSLLLLCTLFRLALNVSSTRLILSQGEQGLGAAGQVIEAFGSFVVQGDFLVGIIIFALIAAINFIVIAKGASRVAEVGARFHLDALPGKQLSIDADLRSGSITTEQAAERRALLAKESHFYGAMDGAMRFVQGDAIASLVITFINAVGGLSVGMTRGLEFREAVDTFGVLTIGDGLASILPALFVSVCAGMIVTNASSFARLSLWQETIKAILSDSRALVFSALVLLVCSLVPGLPFVPFFAVSAAIFGSLYFLDQREEKAFSELPALGSAASPQVLQIEPSSLTLGLEGVSVFEVCELELRLDMALFGEPGESRSAGIADFQSFFDEARGELFFRRGFLLPTVRLSPLTEGSDSYQVFVREQESRRGQIRKGMFFVETNLSTLQLFNINGGIPGIHPITGAEAVWLDSQVKGLAALEKVGVMHYGLFEYLALETLGAALSVRGELFGLSQAREILEQLSSRHPRLIEETFEGGLLSYPECTELLRRLVVENVSIRDVKQIIEAVVEFSANSEEPEERSVWLDELYAFVRRKLSRVILLPLRSDTGRLRCLQLGAELEEEFRSILSIWERKRSKPPIEPSFEYALKKELENFLEPLLLKGQLPMVLLCSGDVRVAVQESVRLMLGDAVSVVSYDELDDKVDTALVGTVHGGSDRII